MGCLLVIMELLVSGGIGVMLLGQTLELECHSLIPMPFINTNLPSVDGYSILEKLGEGLTCC